MEKYILYTRTSTNQQDLGIDAQKDRAYKFADSTKSEIIAEYSEHETGKHNDRPELTKALLHCKKSCATLLVAKIDRLSRNQACLVNLKESGINFRALDLPELNTLTLGIFSGLAQHEREIISQRTSDALQALKRKGVELGNPHDFTEEELKKAAETNRRKAQRNTNNILSIALIKAYLADGNECNYQKIAEYLNSQQARASRGGEHSAKSVMRLIQRYNINNNGE